MRNLPRQMRRPHRQPAAGPPITCASSCSRPPVACCCSCSCWPAAAARTSTACCCCCTCGMPPVCTCSTPPASPAATRFSSWFRRACRLSSVITTLDSCPLFMVATAVPMAMAAVALVLVLLGPVHQSSSLPGPSESAPASAPAAEARPAARVTTAGPTPSLLSACATGGEVQCGTHVSSENNRAEQSSEQVGI